jgi:Ni,Fe-hydrogenase I large subunit
LKNLLNGRKCDLTVAIHQPHYFPWLGYLAKMAEADLFVMLDDVQMNESSPIRRNNFLETNGKTTQLAVSIDRSEMKPIKVTQINYRSKWNLKHMNFLLTNYKKHKYFNQTWPHIENIFNGESENILDLDMKTVLAMRNLFYIKTPLIYQSDLNYDRTAQKNKLLISILQNIPGFPTGGGGLDIFQVRAQRNI